MKPTTIAALVLVLSTGYAIAGAGAPVPEGSQNPPPSGRPSAALDDAACQDVWKMASPNGDTLSKDKATGPFVFLVAQVGSSFLDPSDHRQAIGLIKPLN